MCLRESKMLSPLQFILYLKTRQKQMLFLVGSGMVADSREVYMTSVYDKYGYVADSFVPVITLYYHCRAYKRCKYEEITMLRLCCNCHSHKYHGSKQCMTFRSQAVHHLKWHIEGGYDT